MGSGGVLNPEDLCTKTQQPVINVLQENHSELIIPDLADKKLASFEGYNECLDSVPVMCMEEIVEEMASKLQEGPALEVWTYPP